MRLVLILITMMACQISNGQLIIRNVTIVDVINKKLVPSQDVLVKDGSITGSGKNIEVQNAKVIDGTGKYLMPGLVDAHIHFAQSGGIYTRPDAIDLRKLKPYENEIRWTHDNMESFLRRYLSMGITSVVDVGSTVNFLKQRDSFQNKFYSPSIYMTGPLITTWEPPVFKGLANDEPFYEMKTLEDARNYVLKQLPYKPDFIKVWFIVLERNKDSAARKLLPLVQEVIKESHKNGLRVAVHATEKITASLAVQAGADYLVHSIDDFPVDDEFVRLLKTSNTVLSPTLVVYGNYNKSFSQTYKPTTHDHQYAHPTPLNSLFELRSADTNLTRMYQQYVERNKPEAEMQIELMKSNLKKLADAGVVIATGTDAGNIGTQHVSSFIDELQAMKQSGLTMWQLIEASTINGAKAVGKEKEFGSITSGKRADMLLLDKNPLDDLANWQSINLIINKGHLIKPDSLARYSPEALADQQLFAYNAHNLEAFLEPYAEDVEVYDFPGKISIKGKDEMRKAYNFLNNTPGLYCRLINRIVQGNIVIDHEEVWGFGDKPFYGIAIYEISNGKISKVYFPHNK